MIAVRAVRAVRAARAVRVVRGARSASVCALALLSTISGGCGGRIEAAAVAGARAFADPKLSSSPFNGFSCATCHSASGPEGSPADGRRRIDPGYDLRDVVHRGSWWGGYETRLLDAVNYCVTTFMGGAPLSATEPRARQLYDYLDTVSPDDPAVPLPLTVVADIDPLTALRGDFDRGRTTYAAACARCHGAPHTGQGRITPRTSVIPEDTIAVFHEQARVVAIEKVRHGRFFNIGGVMPLYSAEALRDEDLADILAYLGLLP